MRSLPLGQHTPLRPLALASAFSVLLLAACGGGGDSGDKPSTAVKSTFTGTAATGAALAGATVRIQCSVGTGTVTAGDNGSYTVSIDNATLPCVARAVSSDGTTTLYALVDPAGGTAQTLNINPVTDLVAAKVAGSADLGSFYSAFGSDAAAAAKVTSEAIAGGISSVVGTLGEAGVDFSAVGNPMTAPLVAQTGSSAGNAYDQALDALGAKLTAAGTTQAQLAQAIVAPASGETTPPPSTLLQPAHPDCPSLRSGTYRVLVFGGETDGALRSYRMQVDAPTMTLTREGSSTGFTLPSTGHCTFGSTESKVRMAVSAAGFALISTDTSSETQRMSVAFPEQTPSVADLSGVWNVASFDHDESQSQWVNSFGQATIAADGTHTGQTDCATGFTDCTADPAPLGSFRVNATAGGYGYVNADGSVAGARFFTYKSAAGETTLFFLGGDGQSFGVATRERVQALPALNSLSGRWELAVNAQALAPATLAEQTFWVTGVDAANQTYTRWRTQDAVVNTFRVNHPSNGLIYRAPTTATTVAGTTTTVSEILAMRMPGTGVSVSSRVTNPTTRSQGFFILSLEKPAGWIAAGATPPGTLRFNGGQDFPLRGFLNIDAAGQASGGGYDSHKTAGTMTPCIHSTATASTCQGANASFGAFTQGAPLTSSGSAVATTLSTAPDIYGFSFTGTLTGRTWTGTWTKVATAESGSTYSGTFSMDLMISTTP